MMMKPFQKLYLKHQHNITSPVCVILCHNLKNNQKPPAIIVKLFIVNERHALSQ